MKKREKGAASFELPAWLACRAAERVAAAEAHALTVDVRMRQLERDILGAWALLRRPAVALAAPPCAGAAEGASVVARDTPLLKVGLGGKGGRWGFVPFPSVRGSPFCQLF